MSFNNSFDTSIHALFYSTSFEYHRRVLPYEDIGNRAPPKNVFIQSKHMEAKIQRHPQNVYLTHRERDRARITFQILSGGGMRIFM